jgi:hypothetical protein
MKRYILALTAAFTLLLSSPALSSAAEAATSTQSSAVSSTAAHGQPQTEYAKGYHSGYRAPSSRVRGSYGGSSSYGSSGSNFGSGSYRAGGFGSHLFSFGGGLLLGGMFHPFGGMYGYGGGYGYHSFSFFHIILDLFVLWVLWRIVRRFLR